MNYRWTPEEDEWMKAHYGDKTLDPVASLPRHPRGSIHKRAKALGLKRKVGYLKGSRRNVDERAVCRDYGEQQCIDKVAKAHHIGNVTVMEILKRHGVDVFRGLSMMDPYRDAIIADYRRGDISATQIARRYGFSLALIAQGLRRWGEYDPKRAHAFRPTIGAYAHRVLRYGKEEADRLEKQYSTNRRRGVRRGKAHHMYGKLPSINAGRGWGGWYRDHHFRSLKEACYMMRLEAEGVSWQSAESICIPYVFQGGDRTYHPDFLVGQRLIEIKPRAYQWTENNLAKQLAAEAYCATHGMTYEVTDVTVNSDLLNQAYADGRIRFPPHVETRFLEYARVHNGLGAFAASLSVATSTTACPSTSIAERRSPLSVK